jgi:hypothetical protein
LYASSTPTHLATADRHRPADMLYRFAPERSLPLLAVYRMAAATPPYARPEIIIRRAVRRGASWTAASHLQLTVAAVTRPIRRSVVPLVVRPAELSWLVDRPDGVGRRSVSSVRCPPIRVRRPGSGGGRLVSSRPVSGHLVSSSGDTAVRPSAVHPSSVQPAGVQPVRCPAGWCPPRRSGRVRLLPHRAAALGPGRCGGRPSPRERVESRWAATSSSGSVNGPAGLDAGEAAEAASVSRGVGGGPGPGGCGGGACPLSDQAGQAGVGAPVAGGGAGGRGAGPGASWPHRPRGCRRGWVATTVGGGRGA